jgi:hypothetical protein
MVKKQRNKRKSKGMENVSDSSDVSQKPTPPLIH